MTYYEVLEIRANASTEDIERAFRAMARKVHPDISSGDPGRSDARMKQLNEIRDTLTDPLLRAAYDERLRTAAPIWPAPPPPTATRGFPWTRVALLALGAALVSTTVIVSMRDDRGTSPSPASAETAAADAAPLLSVPRAAKRTPDSLAGPARSWRPGKGSRGMVRLGSSANDVLRVFGPPDRIDVGARAGDAVFVYGDLRLELHDGRVTGGDAAAR